MRHALLYPMASLVFLTMLVYTIGFVARVAAVRTKKMKMDYFRVFEGDEPTALVKKSTRHIANLFEMPVLFYAGCLAAMALDVSKPLLVPIAWAFFGARVLHAIIHIGHNKVMHRLTAFWLGSIAVTAFWITLLL